MTILTKHPILRLLALAALCGAALFMGGASLNAITTPDYITVDLNSVYASKVVQEGQVTSPVANTINTVGLNLETLSLDAVLYAPTEISTSTFHSRLNRLDLDASLQVVDTHLIGLTAGTEYKQFSALSPSTAKTSQMEPFVTATDSILIPVYATVRYNVPTRTTNLEGGASLPIHLWFGLTFTPSAYIGANDVDNEYPHTLKAIKTYSRYYGGGASLGHNLLGGKLTAGVYDETADMAFSDALTWYEVSLSYRF